MINNFLDAVNEFRGAYGRKDKVGGSSKTPTSSSSVAVNQHAEKIKKINQELCAKYDFPIENIKYGETNGSMAGYYNPDDNTVTMLPLAILDENVYKGFLAHEIAHSRTEELGNAYLAYLAEKLDPDVKHLPPITPYAELHFNNWKKTSYGDNDKLLTYLKESYAEAVRLKTSMVGINHGEWENFMYRIDSRIKFVREGK